jgi:hypothetical protein
VSDFICRPLDDVITSAPPSCFYAVFAPKVDTQPERNAAAILRSALVILVAAKKPFWRFMFKRTTLPCCEGKTQS